MGKEKIRDMILNEKDGYCILLGIEISKIMYFRYYNWNFSQNDRIIETIGFRKGFIDTES